MAQQKIIRIYIIQLILDHVSISKAIEMLVKIAIQKYLSMKLQHQFVPFLIQHSLEIISIMLFYCASFYVSL